MVYEFAKKMNAGLVVASVIDQGSTFTLILPVSQQNRSPLDEKLTAEKPDLKVQVTERH
jgi:hypothetical protein